jgi:CBS domain-containing protein
MTNRTLAYIVKDQCPVLAAPTDTVQKACAEMRQRRCGSVLIVDHGQTLVGIFTGRDAVAFVATGGDPRQTRLSEVMTERPVTITPEHRAIDALRLMSEHGFRHLPVLEGAQIWGVISRGDFKGMEIDRLDEEDHLTEVLR